MPHAEYVFPGPVRDRLVNAVLARDKTATTALLEEYRRASEALPDVGDLEAMVGSDGWGVHVRNPGFIRPARTHGGWEIPKDNLNFAYDPFRHGTWSLSWDGEQANLQVWMDQGGQTQPLTLEQDHPITCPA